MGCLQKIVPLLFRRHSAEHILIALEQLESQIRSNLRKGHFRHGSAQHVVFHICSVLQRNAALDPFQVGDMAFQCDAIRVCLYSLRQGHLGHEADDEIRDYSHSVVVAIADHLAIRVRG